MCCFDTSDGSFCLPCLCCCGRVGARPPRQTPSKAVAEGKLPPITAPPVTPESQGQVCEEVRVLSEVYNTVVTVIKFTLVLHEIVAAFLHPGNEQEVSSKLLLRSAPAADVR